MGSRETSENKRISEFNTAIGCRHGQPVVYCAYPSCKKQNVLDCITESGETVRQIAEKFVAAGQISWVEVSELSNTNSSPHSSQRYRAVKLAKLAGAAVIGLALAYEGGKLVLRLVRKK